MNHRRQIACFLGILVSFLLLLSLVSYSAQDQAAGDIGLTDLWKVFTNDQSIQERAAQTSNLVGLLGAVLSNWLINSTIGYAILALPIFGLIWSITLLRKRNVRKLTVVTNYAAVLALLFSALAGTIRSGAADPVLAMEWSGAVGDFLASSLMKLVGATGSTILLAGSFIVLLILMADLDLTRVGQSIKGGGKWFNRQMDRAMLSLSGMTGRMREQLQRRRSARVEIRSSWEEKDAQTGSRKEPRVDRPPVPRRVETPQPARHEPDRPGISEQFEALDGTAMEFAIRERVEEKEVDFDERKQLTEADDEEIDYVQPSVDLLDSMHTGEQVDEQELKANAELLRAKLSDFGVSIESVSVTPGPVVTLYELVPAAGVKISRIESLEDDIALALKAKGIRIIAPIPGKGTVGVEIPNHNPSLVRIRSVINSAKFRDAKFTLPLAIGKTISGEVFIDDLARMPHLLIAGATGSGKSVGINTILASLIYRLHPSDVKFVIIDPKKIELSQYSRLRNHYLATSPDIEEEIVTTPQNAVLTLKSVELEMEKRYDRLASAGVRNIADYNEKVRTGKLHDTESIKHKKIPYLIVVIDELADLMITAAREVEEPIARLAQLARAVGIHLVLATQRPSVDVITGVIKANFSARIAYQVASKTDSRTILDMNGAEQLLGNGDMLYLPPGSAKPTRIQNAFISSDEVEAIMSHISKQSGYSRPWGLPSAFEKKRSTGLSDDSTKDELFEEAAKIVVRHQQGSVSLLQRRLKVGYSRAARLVDELEAAGIVGPFDGSKAREVLVETDAELDVLLRNLI